MKSKHILDALNGIDYDLVEDALEKRRTKRAVWIRWAAAAACVCLVVGGVLAMTNGTGNHECTEVSGNGSFGTESTDTKDPNRLPIEVIQVPGDAPLFYGSEGSFGESDSAAEIERIGVSVTMKAVEMLPDTYTFYGDLRQRKFRLLRMELLSLVKGLRMVDDFYLMVPDAYVTDYTVYDILFAKDLLQHSYEKAVLYNATKVCAEQVTLPIFSWYSVGLFAFEDDGSFDISLWHSTETWENVTKHAEEHLPEGFNLAMAEEAERNKTYEPDIFVTLLSDLKDETADIANQVLNPENGLYAYYVPTHLYHYDPTVQLTCRRYINGFATNEYVNIWGGYEHDGYENGDRTESELVRYSKAKFKDEDLENLPDLSGAMQAVKKAFDAGEITPLHIESYEAMKQESFGIFGWYAKTSDGVVGIVRVTFCYSGRGWCFDDAYYVVECGSQECVSIARDALLEKLGEYEATYIYTDEYDKNGKSWNTLCE